MVGVMGGPLGPLPPEVVAAYGALLRLVPCPLCGRPACESCRGDLGGAEAGIGIGESEVAAPWRLNHADDAFRRAWRVGGGSLLLVGERAAELRGPRGGVVFVPDEDVNDPARRRLRGVAARLGLPLDTGLGAAGPVRVPEPQPGMVWQRERHGLDWTGSLEGGGGDGVDATLASRLPDAPSPEVFGERAVGVAALLGYLRAEAPPPQPPRLVAVESREVERFELAEGLAGGAAGGCLRRTLERHWPDGECERLTVEEALFTASDEAAAEATRPVALAELGPVRASLDGLHRSYVLTCVTPDGTESGWLAAEPGTDPVTELALARFAVAQGLGPDAHLGVSPAGAPPGPERFACPAAARLVERQVTERWRPFPAEELPWARPVQSADLRDLGIPPVAFSPAKVLAVLARLLLPVARRLDRAPEGRRWTMACEAEVTETWAGATSSTTRSYRVGPGEMAWPVLDDGGHLAADFGVDDFGHLHAPHGSWVCPACERRRCRACGDDGELAACDACGQAACGSCRGGGAVTVAAAGCARCGARSCGACHREVGVATCVLCARPVCRRCRGRDDALQAAACCVECATPVRLPEADRRFCRAWVIGGGRWLLVGERSAMLAGGDGEPRVFVPDVDLDDPVRRRVRALASALRLPPETGFLSAGAPPRPAPGPLTAWLHARAEVEWGWVPDTGSQVDRFVVKTLDPSGGPAATVGSARRASGHETMPPEPPADAEPPPVDGEGAAGIAGLLARLREEAPPPPVGSLEVRPFVAVTRVELVADGLEWRRERHWSGGDVEVVEVRRAPFDRSDHAADRPARAVAQATLGPVRATLDAVHASYMVTATIAEGTDGGAPGGDSPPRAAGEPRVGTPSAAGRVASATGGAGGSRSWFVPGARGLSLGSEIAWASLALAAGFAPGAQIRRQQAAPRITDEDFAQPNIAALIERTVRESWRLVPHFPDDGVAGPRELELVGHPAARAGQQPASGANIAAAPFLFAGEEAGDGAGWASSTGPLTLGRALPDGLLGAARRLDRLAAGERVTLARFLEVSERWQGRASADRSYLVAPGNRPWPTLDDSGEEAEDFGVDEAGHLYDPQAVWECPVCGRIRCLACGPQAARETCTGCGQPVCRSCHAAAAATRMPPLARADEIDMGSGSGTGPTHTETEQGVPWLLPEGGGVGVQSPPAWDEEAWCERCSARSCGECGRVVRSERCGLCRRETCRRCRQTGDGRCRTCAELHEADQLERAALPAELAAGGLRVLLAVEDGLTVAVLLGRHRRELAVLRSGRLVRWETVRPDEPELLCARIAVARISGSGDVEIRQARVALPPQPEKPGLVLRRERDDVLHWALLDGTGTMIDGNREPEAMATDDPDAETSAAALGWLLQEAGWGRVVIPDPAAPGLAELLRDLPTPTKPTPAEEPADAVTAGSGPGPNAARGGMTLVVEPRRREQLLWVDAGGLHRSDFDGRQVRRVDAAWSAPAEPAWASVGWSPPPEVVFRATLGNDSAVVVRAGGHVALGIQDAEGPIRWGTVQDRPEELARLAAGVAFCPSQGPMLLEVAELTDPESIVGPVLVGGQLLQRRTSVVLRRMEAGPGGDLAREALAAFVPEQVPVLADRDGQRLSLPSALAAELLARVDRVESQVSRYQVGLGLLVEETWQLGGDSVPLVYELAPGEQAGRLRCQETGTPTATVMRDREGHLVAAALTCRYCLTASCGSCSAPAWPCGVCQIIVCGYCAQTPGDRAPRCPACRDLHPAGWLERRHYSRLLAPRGRLLLGRDTLHQVALVESMDGWQLLLTENGQDLPPTPVDADSAGIDLIERIVAAS